MISLVLAYTAAVSAQADPSVWTNSLGMELVQVHGGTFAMGSADELADPDERPVHDVTLTGPYAIGATTVTVDQFRQFRTAYTPPDPAQTNVTGISWYDAMAFCEWLGAKEGKPYRLPTEAEWEYANKPSGLREWCLDWYGEYSEAAQTDPIGPDSGWGRVVRGGGPDTDDARYARRTNRSSVPPAFGMPAPKEGTSFAAGMGAHSIGFRIVQAPMPATAPSPRYVPFIQRAIAQSNPNLTNGPDHAKPYYRVREILPVPPENTSISTLVSAGLHPALRGHNHSPALEVMPNGDLLALYFSSLTKDEYTPDVALLGTRLRFGADEWDMPEVFLDLADINDGPPLLWNDNGIVRLFWGPTRLQGSYPFFWTTSTDNGATFAEVQCAIVEGEAGAHWRQPVNTALRIGDTIYVPTDGEGGTTVLWGSRNNGATWFDTVGRTGGRHTTFALLSSGAILGMGGKTTAIDGYMPKSISTDGGATWTVTKTPFAGLGSNQRPCVQRLASGRLFFAGDFQHFNGQKPAGITESGAYVALSDDDAETWHIKRLPDARLHESRTHDGATLGYNVARQAPNGIIHLITSMNHPSLHFELNEAWILSETHESQPATWLNAGEVKTTYPNGARQYEATYLNGQRTGAESLWRNDGSLEWRRTHTPPSQPPKNEILSPPLKGDLGGCTRATWTQYWPNGQKKSESIWINNRCESTARRWDNTGHQIESVRFLNGQVVDW